MYSEKKYVGVWSGSVPNQFILRKYAVRPLSVCHAGRDGVGEGYRTLGAQTEGVAVEMPLR